MGSTSPRSNLCSSCIENRTDLTSCCSFHPKSFSEVNPAHKSKYSAWEIQSSGLVKDMLLSAPMNKA